MNDIITTTRSGSEGVLKHGAVEKFAGGLRGSLLRAGDNGYEVARSVWNAMIDRRPALIARPATVEDIVQAVNFAREQQLVLSVRGGGHNVAGNAVCEVGLMIDLSQFRQVSVFPDTQSARAEGGATWGVFDRAAQAHGLATTAGFVSTTGIGGLTLGGGLGWLMGEHGLTIDNLSAVDIVTADGKLTYASAKENPDLFWAVRGGGGNFGVVSVFEYRLHPVGPMVLA